MAVTNGTGQAVTNETTQNVQKRGYNKRPGVSYDTGTAPGKNSRYEAIKAQILAGRVNPSVNQLRKHWQCNYETAAGYLSAMHQEGLLERNEANGQYTLVKLTVTGDKQNVNLNVTENEDSVKNDVTLNNAGRGIG